MNRINDDELFKRYKEIQKTCLKDGWLIPTLINPVYIPPSKRMSFKELDNEDKDIEGLSEKNKRKREIEDNIINGDCDTFDTLMEYYEDELYRFLNEYPQFNDILERMK